MAASPSRDARRSRSLSLCHAVWAREQAYCRAVETNNMQDYRALWREDFLGWPFTNFEPARKGHITDWITQHTSKDDSLKSYKLERLTVQVSGEHGDRYVPSPLIG